MIRTEKEALICENINLFSLAPTPVSGLQLTGEKLLEILDLKAFLFCWHFRLTYFPPTIICMIVEFRTDSIVSWLKEKVKNPCVFKIDLGLTHLFSRFFVFLYFNTPWLLLLLLLLKLLFFSTCLGNDWTNLQTWRELKSCPGWRGRDPAQLWWVASQQGRLVAAAASWGRKAGKKQLWGSSWVNWKDLRGAVGLHRMIFNKKLMDECGEWQTARGGVCLKPCLWN